ncbi:MAG: transketolase C-terminal domain-containing protein, partial [Kiloniellales bacterium]|nr:transketolase C-terminal domain-containing protein [Kiloniellales bacterium]
MAKELNMVEALNLAMREEMEADETVVVLGEDVGVDGGVFRVTKDLMEDFGEERVMDTPLAESAIVGAAIGMAINGLKPVAELQFSGFSYFAFHQIESHAARYRWRSQGRFNIPMVIRMPYGGGVRALEHHSESREAFFAHMPGIRTVVPSGPRNARSLLKAVIQDPDPVIFLEPKALYRSHKETVPEDDDPHPLGQGRLAREGNALTLISYGAMLPRTLEAADILESEHDSECDVIDLL